MARSLTTTDHDTIRKWAEERGGKPSEVASTARGDDVGIIRIDFPGFSGEGKLQEISWDDWFKKFDEASLAFVYEEETADGQRSNFNKLVGRETAEKRAEGVKTNRRALRSGSAKAKAGRSGTSRQAARMEAGRTTRAKRSGGGASSSGRGSAASRKKTTGRKATASRRATTGRSASRSASTRSTSGRSSSGGAARKAGRSSARKSR